VIFVGDGALLWRAVRHAVDRGHAVDMVCTGGLAAAPASVSGVDVRTTDRIDPLAGEIHAACTDGLVWSTDNRFLFGEPVLSGDVVVYNIHGGPLPGYRGVPLATVAYAILNDEPEFAATLHRVDPGIDTGPVVAEDRFPIDPEDVFEDVMAELVEACHRLFVENLDAAVAGTLTTRPQPDGPSGYYGNKAVGRVPDHRDDPNYERATDLGMFEDFFPDAAAAWR
jgi:methionyl-tRNA formyltransferase